MIPLSSEINGMTIYYYQTIVKKKNGSETLFTFFKNKGKQHGF